MKKAFQDKRILIIITGGPGTGKSGIADRLLAFLDDPEIERISYDEIKEREFDRFGFDDEADKDRLNSFSLEEFYLTLKKAMWENKTILIEYPFYQRHKPKLKELIEKYHYYAATVLLYTDMHTVYERFITRNEGKRHPGHLLNRYHIEDYDPAVLKTDKKVPDFGEFSAGIAHKDYDIGLGLSIPVDVSDFSSISFEEIYEKIVEYQRSKSPLKSSLIT